MDDFSIHPDRFPILMDRFLLHTDPSSANHQGTSRYAQGIPIAGKPGFVKSPYAPAKGDLDVRRFRKGAEMRCPYTGKIFIVP
jgi:hypothetical protein